MLPEVRTRPSFVLSARRVAVALIALWVVVLSGGVAVWAAAEKKYSLLDSLYFALITVTTVGYAEPPDFTQHRYARLITALTIVLGLGAIALFQSTLTALLVEGYIGRAFRKFFMQRQITELKDHYILVGAGRIGRYIAEELYRTGRRFVVVERNASIVQRLSQEFGVEILHVIGDATEDHVLLEAGVERAVGLVVALTDDRDNLFVTLSARALNPRVRIVTKVVEAENEAKVLRAGASKAVSTQVIGGLRLVNELIRPEVTRFLDQMLLRSDAMRFEELLITERSSVVGRNLRQLEVRRKTDLLVVAKHLPDDTYEYNPDPGTPLQVGERLIVLGRPEGIEALRQLIGE